ncbi:hypothetical protein [Bradyrhizobium sp. LA2.1]|uniref:hypothetical protein n=1 Tax=Bradyrhizobium sp. LA2.1 TaxID=3156376 RepID=UPI00339A39CB
MKTPMLLGDRAARRAQQPDSKTNGPRLGYKISEWSKMTGTSRATTWRAIKTGKLKALNYFGIKLIPESERARLFQL